MTVREYMRLYDRLSRALADYQAARGWVERRRAAARMRTAEIALRYSGRPRRLTAGDAEMTERLLEDAAVAYTAFRNSTEYADQAAARVSRDIRDGKLVEG